MYVCKYMPECMCVGGFVAVRVLQKFLKNFFNITLYLCDVKHYFEDLFFILIKLLGDIYIPLTRISEKANKSKNGSFA